MRVLPDSGQGADPNGPLMLHIALPDGKTGFIDAQSLSPLGGDQMCYTKDGARLENHRILRRRSALSRR